MCGVNVQEVLSALIGMRCPGELSQQNIKVRYYGVNDHVAVKLLNKAGEMPSLEASDDESIKTLYVGGLDKRITEQDLRDNFYAHGEIESIKMVLDKACAFVTYTTREGAEKAAEELSSKLVIKGLRLKLMWGKPQAPRPESETSEGARQQAVAHSGMLPRAVISQQQNQFQPSGPGMPDQLPPMQYFNIPPPPQTDRAYYPSMDPQRMGAFVPSQDGENKPGSEKQGKHYPYQGIPPPPPGQYPHQHHYPPYGYMQPMPPYQQYPPYHSGMPPPRGPPQHYQHSAPTRPPTSAPPAYASSSSASAPAAPAAYASSSSASAPAAPGPSAASESSHQ